MMFQCAKTFNTWNDCQEWVKQFNPTKQLVYYYSVSFVTKDRHVEQKLKKVTSNHIKSHEIYHLLKCFSSACQSSHHANLTVLLSLHALSMGKKTLQPFSLPIIKGNTHTHTHFTALLIYGLNVMVNVLYSLPQNPKHRSNTNLLMSDGSMNTIVNFNVALDVK